MRIRSVLGAFIATFVALSAPAKADLILSWDGPASIDLGVPTVATLQMIITDSTTVTAGGLTWDLSPPTIADLSVGLSPGTQINAGPSGLNWASFTSIAPGGLTAGTYDLLDVTITADELGMGTISLSQMAGNPFQLFQGQFCPENPVLPAYEFAVVPVPSTALLFAVAGIGFVRRRRSGTNESRLIATA